MSQNFVPTIKQFVVVGSFDTTKLHDDALYELRRWTQGDFRPYERIDAYVCLLSST